MRKKVQEKITLKINARLRKVKYSVAICVMILAGSYINAPVMARECPELMIVFARGSGAEKDTNDNYITFREAIESKIGEWGITHEYLDLDYEAKGIGVDNIWTLVGAFFGAGDAYDFGRSVDEGVDKLVNLVKNCPTTKFVLGGYSQGAMVVSRGIHSIPVEQVIYAATFGDPKIYLPEGKAWFSYSMIEAITGSQKNVFRTGTVPVACKGENLSEYRMYVPDCYAYEGMLGSYRPYQPVGYEGKLGTWCNKYDMFCSSYLSASSHTAYVADGLYEDASKVIAKKIAEGFGIEDGYVSLHDTAFLIDSTDSMGSMIERYTAEATNLAEETLKNGGRVALYDFRDYLFDGEYSLTKRCEFGCTLEEFKAGLAAIETDGGGDDPESILGASFAAMKELNWQYGATKSLIILTDNGFHDPDYDGRGTRLVDVVKLSKEIDPVNIYVVTREEKLADYEEITAATGGRVVTRTSELSELTELIMAKVDALPRVEEEDGEEVAEGVLPAIQLTGVDDAGSEVKMRFLADAKKVGVVVNEAFLGMTDDIDEITVTGLDRSIMNTISLVPFSETRRGEMVSIPLEVLTESEFENVEKKIIPRAPDTGRKG